MVRLELRYHLIAQYKELPMDTFTVRDLRERTGDLIRDAVEGKLSMVTRHGKPVFVAVPFDEALLRSGVHVVMAVKLFDEGHISLGKAARLADMSVAEFMEHLASLNIPVARPEPEELEQELAAFR
jgi:prevent-host-death family protein